MLEFLYTDHVDFASVDPSELLVLADNMMVARLVTLCELAIITSIDRQIEDTIEKSDLDLVGMIEMAGLYHAPQLEAWLLHFMASNYGPVKKRGDLEKLSDAHRMYCIENQWPPVKYLKAVDEYEEAVKKTKKATPWSKKKKAKEEVISTIVVDVEDSSSLDEPGKCTVC